MSHVRTYYLLVLLALAAPLCVHAQYAPPAPFTISGGYPENWSLIRLDHLGYCSAYGMDQQSYTFRWQQSYWTNPPANIDTTDTIHYTWVALIDSVETNGSITSIRKAVRCMLSSDSGLANHLTLTGEELYNILWTDGKTAMDRTDSLITDVQWYVIATNKHGDSTLSDTAGVSLTRNDLPNVTPSLVVSINRPPRKNIYIATPPDGAVFTFESLDTPIDIIWNAATDLNELYGIRKGLFRSYNPVTRAWEQETTGTPLHIPSRTIDTLQYQWRATVTNAWPASNAHTVIGRTIVYNIGKLNGKQFLSEEIDYLFNGFDTKMIDSIAIEHCIYVKDWNSREDGSPIPFFYKGGQWITDAAALESDTAMYSEFGCLPHVVKAGCWHMLITRSEVSSTDDIPSSAQTPHLDCYPNPFAHIPNMTYVHPESGNVRVSVYDLTGKEIAVLHEGYQNAGTYSVSWNAAQAFPRGIYLLRYTSLTTQTTLLLMHQ